MIKSSYLTFVDLAGEITIPFVILFFPLSPLTDSMVISPDADNVAQKSFTALATVVNLLSENSKHQVEGSFPHLSFPLMI
jgi:hypothetical protein